jgi:AMP deaminase
VFVLKIIYCFIMMNLVYSAGSESPTFGGNTAFPFAKMTLDDLTAGSTSPRLLCNEISAPYEVPQFPIEQLEKKLAIQRQLSSR